MRRTVFVAIVAAGLVAAACSEDGNESGAPGEPPDGRAFDRPVVEEDRGARRCDRRPRPC